jgi:hypothetical protein
LDSNSEHAIPFLSSSSGIRTARQQVKNQCFL